MAEKHPRRGALLALLDGELSEGQRQTVERHIAGCEACHHRLASLTGQSARITDALSALAPMPGEGPEQRAALTRLKTTLEGRENLTMIERFKTDRSLHRAMAGIAIVLALAGAFAFQPVRALASDFLSLFRVEKVTVIEIDPERLEQIAAVLDEGMMPGEINMLMEMAEPQTVATLEEAAALAGFTPSHAAGYPAPTDIAVMSGGEIDYTPDLENLRAILETLELDPAMLPDNLDDQPIHATILPGVFQLYDDGDPDIKRDYLVIEAPSPIVEVPDGVDLRVLGDAMLQVLGFSPEEAAQLSASIDWTSTLVLPLPTDIVSVRDVTIRGTSGLYLELTGEVDMPTGAILWTQDGRITMVAADGNLNSLVRLAESLNH